MIEEIKDNQTVTYIYNENGDLIEKSSGEKYTYDIQGNLTAINGNGIDQSFTYNGNGNRLSKTVDGETTYFINDVNRAYEQVLQTYNEDGSTINTYTYGLQRIDSKGEINETYLYDGRGSVVGAVGSDNSVFTYSYTAYGVLMPDSPTPNVFGYNAEATDYSTGMQYLRARYYDTGVQRFVQEDDYRGKFTNPASMNRYIYVGSNPANRVDPSGYGWLKNQISKIVDTVSSTVKNIFTTKTTTTTTTNAVSKRIGNANKTSSTTKIIDKDEYNYQLWLEDQGLSDKEKMEKYDPFLNDTVTIKEYLENKDIRRNTKIVPTELEYGMAGYINGEYCNDGGEAKKQELMQKGVPEYIANTIIPTIFTPMSESEVQGRNEVLYEAIKPMNVVWQSPVDIRGYNGVHFDADTVYRGVIYSMNSYHNSPEEFLENVYKGEGALYRAGDNYHLSGEDCSGSASRAWGMVRRTTLGIHDNIKGLDNQEQEIYKVGEYNMNNYYIASREEAERQLKLIAEGKMSYPVSDSEKNTLIEAYAGLAPGDQVYKRGLEGHHVMTVLEIDGDNVIFVEQVQPTTRISEMSFQDLADDLYMPITKWDD